LGGWFGANGGQDEEVNMELMVAMNDYLGVCSAGLVVSR